MHAESTRLCDIVILDDDVMYTEDLGACLSLCGHAVYSFHDLASFREAIRGNKFFWFKSGRPIVLLLDLYFQCDLQDTGPESWMPVHDLCLGLRVGTEVRNGQFEPAIPTLTPIVFCTASMDRTITEFADETMQPCRVWRKPAMFEDLHDMIQEVVRSSPGDGNSKGT